jgi:hypothetical protein
VAVAKVNNATAIYSDDNGLATFASQMGIDCIHSWDLPLPKAKQIELFENESGEEP